MDVEDSSIDLWGSCRKGGAHEISTQLKINFVPVWGKKPPFPLMALRLLLVKGTVRR